MARPTGGRLDLLRQAAPPGPEDRPAPGDPDREGDGFAPSRHSRLEVAPPDEEPFDGERAESFCGELARGILGDFAVGLPLLGAAGRRRAQVLVAWSCTLFDLAGQAGFEGGKLAAINRWEFDMETALDGAPQQQPIFAALGQEHRRQPWPLEALDALIDLARRQASASLPHEDSRREARYRKLATALVHALWNEVLPEVTGTPSPEVTVTLVATVLAASAGPAGEQRARWIARIRGLRPSSRWPRSHRRAFSFLRGAGLVLLRQDASEATQEGRQTLRLSLGSRLRLVFRALLA